MAPISPQNKKAHSAERTLDTTLSTCPSETSFTIRFADPLGNRRPRIFDSSDPTVTFPVNEQTHKLWNEDRKLICLPYRHSYHICHHINPAHHRKVSITNSPSHKGLWQQDWSPPGKIEHRQLLRSFSDSGALSKARKEEYDENRMMYHLAQTPTRKQEVLDRCTLQAKQSPSQPVILEWRNAYRTHFVLK